MHVKEIQRGSKLFINTMLIHLRGAAGDSSNKVINADKAEEKTPVWIQYTDHSSENII
jgi:hypothetical protein